MPPRFRGHSLVDISRESVRHRFIIISSTVSHHLTELCTSTVNYETVSCPQDTRTDVHSHYCAIFQIYFNILLSPEMSECINRILLVDQLQILTMGHTGSSNEEIAEEIEQNVPSVLKIISRRSRITKCSTSKISRRYVPLSDRL